MKLAVGLICLGLYLVWMWYELKNAPVYDEKTGRFIFKKRDKKAEGDGNV